MCCSFTFCLQIFYDRGCRIDPEISHDQDFFDLLIKILIYCGKSAENRINAGYNIVSCLGQSFYQAFKKSFFLSAILLLLFSLIQCFFDQIYRNQSGDAFFLHGDAIQPVRRCHRSSSVCNNNKLRILCQLVQIICIAAYVAHHPVPPRSHPEDRTGTVLGSGWQKAGRSPSRPSRLRRAASYSAVFCPAAER